MQADVIVNGGGIVGACLALGLARLGWQVLLLEASQGKEDKRAFALNAASVNILQALFVWPRVVGAARAVSEIQCSEQKRFGVLQLSVPGAYVVPAQALKVALHEQLLACRGITYLEQTRAKSIRMDAQGCELDFAQASWLVAADGIESSVRSALHIPVERHDYGQIASVVNIEVSEPNGVAYERLTPEGLLAVVPLPGRQLKCIWMASTEHPFHHTPEIRFLQDILGWRLGHIQTMQHLGGFPLQRVLAKQLVKGRALLMGQAAQALHPAGAQGLNLALRDVAAWFDLLKQYHGDWGQALLAYPAARLRDHRQIQFLTHQLGCAVAPRTWVGRGLRTCWHQLLRWLPPVRTPLLAWASGLSSGLPRLARGGHVF